MVYKCTFLWWNLKIYIFVVVTDNNFEDKFSINNKLIKFYFNINSFLLIIYMVINKYKNIYIKNINIYSMNVSICYLWVICLMFNTVS